MTRRGAAMPPTVGSVMHSGVVTCSPAATLRTVARIMAAHGIHAVVVVSVEEVPVPPCAVVTDRDVIFAHATGRLDRLTAREAATDPTITVRRSLDLRSASELMMRHGVAHIVVTDTGDHRAIGIVSSLDIAGAVGDI
jgi:CBS domain-containing protein